jgi:uncharacterized SAM-binding protein YcdF (DUF218 family)
MSFFLSKLLPVFVYPLGFSIFLAIVAGFLLWLKRKRLATTCFILSLSVLWISSTPVVSDALYRSLTQAYPPVSVADTPDADAIIVLGGGLGSAAPPRISVDLGSAADRVLHAARLYRAGKAPLVIVSGGGIPWLGSGIPESQAMATLLAEWGVPAKAILREEKSRNTYENAVETHTLFRAQNLQQALLVTSALHMPRALAVFKQTGMAVVAAPTDYEIIDSTLTILDFLPDARALERSTRVIKEYIGRVVYQRRGWM